MLHNSHSTPQTHFTQLTLHLCDCVIIVMTNILNIRNIYESQIDEIEITPHGDAKDSDVLERGNESRLTELVNLHKDFK